LQSSYNELLQIAAHCSKIVKKKIICIIKRETEERKREIEGRERKNKKIIKKEYLNGVLKKIEVLIEGIL